MQIAAEEYCATPRTISTPARRHRATAANQFRTNVLKVAICWVCCSTLTILVSACKQGSLIFERSKHRPQCIKVSFMGVERFLKLRILQIAQETIHVG